MKLYLLRPVEGLKEPNPWTPWYDKSFGHVVRAETEEEARRLANEAGGDEKGKIRNTIYRTGGDPWFDPTLSSCIELLPEGIPGVIITDFASA